MRPIDNTRRHGRQLVAERFRVFMATLTSQFTTTPAELLKRAEVAHDRREHGVPHPQN
jgi:hypothetical protein